MKVRTAGDLGILVELPEREQVLRLFEQLREHPVRGQREIVPAASTLLITTDSADSAARARTHIGSLDLSAAPVIDDRLVTVDVVYDGEDLEEVAGLTGMRAEDVIRAHTAQTWTAAFGGFAPGFVHLRGEDDRLEVSRRPSPRTSVPAGSVAIAGGYSAVYPRDSPGGWRIIGRTSLRLWDLERAEPALIRPGNRVRFRAVTELPAPPPEPRVDSRAAPSAETGVEILDPGMLSLVEDLGRPGFAHLGVTGSGAADRAALKRANRIVGNPREAAGIEVLNGGLSLRALGDQVLAVTGAPLAVGITAQDGTHRDIPFSSPFVLLAGETLGLGRPAHGLRTYLALRGGLDSPIALGSRSSDTLSGLGERPLIAGQRVPVRRPRNGSVVGFPEPGPDLASEVTVLRAVLGPRADWFSAQATASFGTQNWLVTPHSDRIGIRLEGEPLERARDGELDSEGVTRGAVEVPPNGLPLIFLADHPVTGGYPVLCVVIDSDQDRMAQLRPGDRVRFALED